MNAISIVIPTYNRCKTLRKALSRYFEQTALQNIAEIIVVDDGSTDSTRNMVTEISHRSSIPIKYFHQMNKGPAAARNVGISEVTSNLILFTDDDIVPRPTLVAEHLEWQHMFPEVSTAVLGKVTWAPEVKPTPFMRWYGGEMLFLYAQVAAQTELDYRYFYSCNVSLKVDFLRSNGVFDEDFKVASYEDIELGYRLQRAQMRLLYNSRALAYHEQYISFEDACQRLKKQAAASEVFRDKEAGRYLARTSHVKRRLKKPLGFCLSPFRNLMDCRLALPGYVYRSMLRIYC
jgi:glycosyltransferase involved in cell wall biosynthesis